MTRIYEHKRALSEMIVNYLVRQVYSKPLKESTLTEKLKQGKFTNYEIY